MTQRESMSGPWIERLHSRLPEAAWPALPSADGAAKLALLAQLDDSQWWPEAELRRHQFRQLRELVAHAWRTVPFYRDRLDAAGIKPHAELAPELWQGLPVLSRRELQAAGPALASNQVPPEHGKSVELSSSGSTGMPVTVLWTTQMSRMWGVQTLRNHLWHGRDLGAKFATIRRLKSEKGRSAGGVSSRRWGNWANGLVDTGPIVALDIGADAARQIDWLRAQQAAYFLTYPSNLATLLALPGGRRNRPDSLRQVQTMAEILPPELRQVCADVWGVPVIDMYTAQETGYVALQCPDHPHYHVQSESIMVEILDDSGRACAPGDVGRVVVTPLHGFAMPLLRYELGDYAEVGEPCPCGRGLPVLRRIVGRVRNTLIGPNGARYWPAFGSRTFTRLAPIVQHQFVQKSLDVLEARLVTTRPLEPGEEDALRRHLLAALPPGFRIEFVYPVSIPRSVGGKFEDFISEVAGR